jgi:hypothetical protein
VKIIFLTGMRDLETEDENGWYRDVENACNTRKHGIVWPFSFIKDALQEEFMLLNTN